MATHENEPRVDYLIIGGGTAGLVIANRLTEDANISVTVLEAGNDATEDPRVNIPALWTTLSGTEMDWKFASEPQPHITNRVISLPAGKMLGGSSALNGQTLVAPSQSGIDAWAALGNSGWDWSTLSPYYRKFYTLHLPDEKTREHLGLTWIDESVRGVSGPIQASFTGTVDNPVPKAWVQAFNRVHFGTTADPFTGKSVGGYSNVSTVDPATKTRSYAASAYARPVLSRPNLKLMTGATVQRILFEKSDGQEKAKAVEVIIDGEKQTLQADKEVVLAAGVFQSPKILELSGIGDKTLLQKHKIPVLIDNSNVGEHMQDHLLTGISYELIDGIPSLDPLMRQEPEALQRAQEQYASRKEGPLCVGGISLHAYMPIMEFTNSPDGEQRLQSLLSEHIGSHSSPEERLVRDVISHGQDGSGAYFLLQGQGLTHENEANADHGPIYQPGNYASIGVCQTHPLSRGSSHIKSSEPSSPPTIDPGYFRHPLDLEIMARHVLGCEKMRHTEPLNSLFKPNGRRNHVRAQVKTLDDAKRYLQETARTTYHCCGTCSMRPRSSGGVVDSTLIVYGTSNLRVVDASIFPLISRGNTMSTVYAVAERAADIIRGKA
ncbi:MAG: hypothetical protein Q9159_002421 [Coniocarpon cinnabarinum]